MGLVLLIGFLIKIVILIVEFVMEEWVVGKIIFEVVLNVVKLCFRVVLMMVLLFVFGVLLLVFVSGVGVGSWILFGIIVLFGMLVVIIFGILLVLLFYILV